MPYKTYRYDIRGELDERALVQYLNELEGEVITIVPNIIPKFHMMGATASYNYLVIVVKVNTASKM